MPAFTPEETFSLWRASRCSTTRLKPTSQLLELDGLTMAFTDVEWPPLNAAFFSRPAVDEDEAVRRIETARDFFRQKGRRWGFTLRGEYVTPPVEAALRRCGLDLVEISPVMGAERLTPGRPPPPELDCRLAHDPDGLRTLMEINAAAFHVPLEWAREVAAGNQFDLTSAFPYVGWVDGKPAAAAVTVRYEGSLYVVWVSTMEEFRHRGYAEAVMRRSYEEASAASGLERVALHSSPAGIPLYQRMGFREVSRIYIYKTG
jgi:ribosomal protein S18 acetylase RimI-like enzyme